MTAEGAEEEPEHLVRLNPEQRAAVTSITGPVLVLAGAGSGKTRVLTRRIAHLLHCGVAPDKVLAVTFTNKAAAEMRERVAELIGANAERVWVSTFHSTCARILRTDIEHLGYTRRFAIYDDDDQLRLLKGIIAGAGYDPGRIDAREISSRIDHYKNRMLGPDEVLDERRSHVGDPLIRVWREYDDAMKASDALDFNDLIGKVVTLFETVPEVLAKWRDRFGYVLVDEYQDTNRGQYKLLRLLADEHRNIAVVGDDDQSIYGFRGAEVSNILSFQTDYPEAKVVRLEQNYRSTGNILALANAVVAHNTGRLEKKLWTESPNGPKVQLMVAQGPREEGARVADAIGKLRRMGIAAGEIAIVYRTNAVARHFEAALRSARIAHKVVGGRKFYERREVRDLLAFLRLVVNPGDDAAFLRIVNVPPRGVGTKTLADLRLDAHNRGLPLLATARARGAGRSAGEKGISAFTGIIDALSDLARDVGLAELVREVIDRSGYRAWLESDRDANGAVVDEAKGRLENLDALVADVAAFPTPEGTGPGPMDKLVAWLDRVALSADSDDVPDGGEVTLMTVHSSKGLEYPVVFVVQMNEGMFPHERNAEAGLEEERRLAYVAFTRAMQRLIVTRSVRDITGSPAAPSRFLYGVPLEVLDGEVPGGDPVTGEREQRRIEADEATTKLGTFLAHRQRRMTPIAPPPEEQYTVIDVESAEQLAIGVRILHPNHGVGEIRRLASGKLQVEFASKLIWIPPTRELKIVAD
ncbi:MAG: UvrD-helicase domain-containing protein [Myxococcota bacterium]